MEKNDQKNMWLEHKGIESKEGIPEEPVEIFYLFRHDPPIYDPAADEKMKEHGFSGEKNYGGAQFGKFEIPEIPEKDLPQKKKLQNLSRSSKSKIIIPDVATDNIYQENGHETQEELMARAKFEGGTDEIKERKNLNYLADLIKEKNFKPIMLVGPRTRHLFTYNSVVNALEKQGVDIDEPILSHTDKLTDINSHWLPLMEVAEELNIQDPWGTVKDPNFHEEMNKRGIETMEEIEERIKNYLIILERWWKKQNNLGKINQEVKPIFIGFTSDFEQRALIRLMGIEKINGVNTNYFKSDSGSYISVEVAKNGTAKIYYQSPNNEKHELLGEVADFQKTLK
ncbi:MAG: hypothetical protein WC499_01965 [Patescibacteria group bacterium]